MTCEPFRIQIICGVQRGRDRRRRGRPDRGFAIYRASHDGYQDNYLPTGQLSGTPEEALDCACGLYLGDPTAWLTPPGTDTPTD